MLAGIGVTPNIALAKAAGLATGSGVLADERLRAGDDIWVAGDIAEYQSVIHGRRLRIEHWDVALNHGGYVGRSWAGGEQGPTASCPTSSPTWPTGRGWSTSARPALRRGRVRGSMDDDDFVAYYSDARRNLTACLGVNRSDEVNEAKALIAHHQPLPA